MGYTQTWPNGPNGHGRMYISIIYLSRISGQKWGPKFRFGGCMTNSEKNGKADACDHRVWSSLDCGPAWCIILPAWPQLVFKVQPVDSSQILVNSGLIAGSLPHFHVPLAPLVAPPLLGRPDLPDLPGRGRTLMLQLLKKDVQDPFWPHPSGRPRAPRPAGDRRGATGVVGRSG